MFECLPERFRATCGLTRGARAGLDEVRLVIGLVGTHLQRPLGVARHAPEDHKVFHKTLKSGCRAEQARLRTVEWLVRLIEVFCILGWRVF